MKASHEFFRMEEADHVWPHAMLDTNLATLVWLKQPHRAPDLPRKQIVADCYAALHPDDKMWNRWLAEIQRIADNGDYGDAALDIMRFSPDAQRALMDVTLGDE
ncbi:MAG: tudor domain-containing protein [Acidimicrobiales bacterium]